jgi:3-phenylpropionate/trans-cinnamate dioxygenase ferredoxin component
MAIQNLLCNSYFFTSEITFDDASLKILEKDKIIDNVSNSITDMEWIKVCDNSSLGNGDLVGFDYDDKKILISKVQDKIYATDRICTHQYADLSTGFLNEEEKTITCPLHLSVFKLENGMPQNPPAEISLKTYNVKMEDNGVYIFIE